MRPRRRREEGHTGSISVEEIEGLADLQLLLVGQLKALAFGGVVLSSTAFATHDE